MIKVLWVCNVPIPKIANDMGIKVPNICGWLTGFANEIELQSDIELHICFPQLAEKHINKGKIGNVSYYSFSQPKVMGFLPAEDQLHASSDMVNHIKEIIQQVKPDVLHIFGTEYPHALVAAKVFGKPEKTVVSIQGLTSVCWKHYNTGIPYRELKRFTLSSIVRGNLLKQAERLKKRGRNEIEVIKSVEHVIGRTDWDQACVKQINPNVQYHFCNESLRDSFYTGEWSYENCEKYSIFMSQAATPIKGLHYMVEALHEVLQLYPLTHLYIAGNDLTNTESLYNKLKISPYGKYINRLIRKYQLYNNITFTGQLSEQQIKERFLKSNVYVLASTVENSPNSLGEAMLLGLPSICSDVGGVKNMMNHGSEGYVYQSDAPYMLSYYLKKIFSDVEKTVCMGNNAREHAHKTHDRKRNASRLIEIYRDIIA